MKHINSKWHRYYWIDVVKLFEQFRGAKVNNIPVDGMSFIEKLSFNPFSEGKRLIHCTTLHKRLFSEEKKAKDAVRQELARVRAPKIDFCRGTTPLS